ncbi:hypothetical protein BDV96DRAFT_666363 [Lophiotrema nucula]|uniref:Uncharacterized protein n=1 Tax=Lophiotrema nucula TaxID=690887 RepID=A0A6A5YVB0_9PLEO|nr:hypothetical protein BDV96DRAFT_666363 [Lophiotrema nucula]
MRDPPMLASPDQQAERHDSLDARVQRRWHETWDGPNRYEEKLSQHERGATGEDKGKKKKNNHVHASHDSKDANEECQRRKHVWNVQVRNECAGRASALVDRMLAHGWCPWRSNRRFQMWCTLSVSSWHCLRRRDIAPVSLSESCAHAGDPRTLALTSCSCCAPLNPCMVR